MHTGICTQKKTKHEHCLMLYYVPQYAIHTFHKIHVWNATVTQ